MLTGIDASLEISLGEYGFAWKEESEDFKFYYGMCNDSQGNFITFDFCFFKKDLDVKKEFNWIDWKSFLSFIGLTEKEFLSQGLPYQIFDLYNYFGFLNIFGDSYTEGILIEKLLEKEGEI